jgi:hypothetical protein
MRDYKPCDTHTPALHQEDLNFNLSEAMGALLWIVARCSFTSGNKFIIF